MAKKNMKGGKYSTRNQENKYAGGWKEKNNILKSAESNIYSTIYGINDRTTLFGG
jgi:hypothetical protein